MSNVKVVEVDFTGDVSRHQDVVGFLDRMKGKAVEDKAVFALVIMIGADESVIHGWTPRGGRPFGIVGAIEFVKARFMKENIE